MSNPTIDKNHMTESRQILVADDDDNIRAVIVEVVRSLGFTPLEVSDGHAAMRAVQNPQFDAALLDVSMPGHTGIEVCAALKGNEEGELIPVILLTAKDSLDDKVVGLESGADEYLTKPFQFRELQARIKACIRIRELHLKLRERTEELKKLQNELIARERQSVVGQMGGAAAHAMGQPISAILLNLFLIEQLEKTDSKYVAALAAMKSDANRLKELVEKIRSTDPNQQMKYFGTTEIIKINEDD